MDNSNTDYFSDKSAIQIISDIFVTIYRNNYITGDFEKILREKTDIVDLNKNYYKTIIFDILEKLKVVPEITFNNSFILISTFRKFVHNDYCEYVYCISENDTDEYCKVDVIDKHKFAEAFRQRYGQEYNDILGEILDKGYFMSPYSNLYINNCTFAEED